MSWSSLGDAADMLRPGHSETFGVELACLDQVRALEVRLPRSSWATGSMGSSGVPIDAGTRGRLEGQQTEVWESATQRGRNSASGMGSTGVPIGADTIGRLEGQQSESWEAGTQNSDSAAAALGMGSTGLPIGADTLERLEGQQSEAWDSPAQRRASQQLDSGASGIAVGDQTLRGLAAGQTQAWRSPGQQRAGRERAPPEDTVAVLWQLDYAKLVIRSPSGAPDAGRGVAFFNGPVSCTPSHPLHQLPASSTLGFQDYALAVFTRPPFAAPPDATVSVQLQGTARTCGLVEVCLCQHPDIP